MTDTIDIKAVVRGRVQGVGFRATVHHHATILGLVGTVRNLSDGSVEICVRGPKSLIDRLFSILQEDEFPGYIKELYIEESPLSGQSNAFVITF